MSIESVIPSNHLVLCCPLLLLPSVFPSIRVFSNESVFCIRWPKYWSFSFSVNPSNEHPGLISFRMDRLDLLAVQRTLQESSPTPQFKSINSSALSFLYSPTLTSIHAAAKSLQCPTLCDPIDGSPPGSPSLGFSRQQDWSGLPFPSPMHESEKWKWSRSVVSDSLWPHGLQPTRLLCPWDFPGKSTGVGCHCLLCLTVLPAPNKDIFSSLILNFHSYPQIILCSGFAVVFESVSILWTLNSS